MFIPASCAQINLRYQGQAIPNGAETTFGVAIGDHTTPVELAESVRDALTAGNFLGPISSSMNLVTIRVKMGPNDDGPMTELSVNLFGGKTGDCFPPQVAFLVRKNTALGGKKNQGRWFLPGVATPWADAAGRLTPAAVAEVQTAMDSTLEELTTAGCSMVLLHSVERPSDMPLGVTQLSVNGLVATQRRRLRP